MSNEEKSFSKTSINWYPGHMAKTKREIKEKIDANKDTVKRNLTAQKQNRLSDGIGFFDDVIPSVKEKPKKKESNRDLLF